MPSRFAGIAWLASRWLRSRGFAALPLALVVGLGTVATMLSLAAAERTRVAYGEHLDEADVGDVVINPSVNTREIDAVIRSLPGVEQVTAASVFIVSDDVRPRPREVSLDTSTAGTGVFGSSDGQYLDMDRPILREGRLPTGTREAVLNVEAAEAEGLGVGDTLELAFWSPANELELAGAAPEDQAAMARELVSPIGVEQVTIVGIVTLSDEVLPDDLYPRQRAIVSPDIAARYSCLPETPGGGLTYAASVERLAPPGCAAAYTYYSLRLAEGAADVKPALDEFLRRIGPLNAELAEVEGIELTGQDPPQYFLIPIESDEERRRVQTATRPTVTALRGLAAAVAAITLALAGLLATRELRRVRPVQERWRELGLSRDGGAFVLVVPLALAAVIGAGAGIATASTVDVGPVGLLRVLESDPPDALFLSSLLAGLGLGALTLVLVVALGLRSSRMVAQPAPRPFTAPRWLPPVGASPATVGLRAAVTSRSTSPLVVSLALLFGAFVASVVFAASLASLVSTPRDYGWPWDLAAITGSGYGGLDLDAAERELSGDPDVESWTALGLELVTIGDEPMVAVVGFDRTSTVDLRLLDGALPHGRDEVAFGATTASRLGVGVGDDIDLGGLDGYRATVTGIVVLPSLGPFMADRVGTGTGVLLPEAATKDLGPPFDTSDVFEQATFVGVDLRDGSTGPADAARVATTLRGLDRSGSPVFEYASAVRPPPIIDADSTRSVPVAVGALFGATIMVVLVSAWWSVAPSRAREIAVLRSIGFTRAQACATIATQAVVTVTAAILIGVPLGITAGRLLWRAHAEQLGVIPDPVGAWALVAVIALAGVLLTAVTAQLPARMATRAVPARGLRDA